MIGKQNIKSNQSTHNEIDRQDLLQNRTVSEQRANQLKLTRTDHARALLLFLRFPDSHHQKILVFDVVASQSVGVRQHLPVKGEHDTGQRNAAIDMSHDMIAESRYQERDRDFGKGDHATIQFPFRFR